MGAANVRLHRSPVQEYTRYLVVSVARSVRTKYALPPGKSKSISRCGTLMKKQTDARYILAIVEVVIK